MENYINGQLLHILKKKVIHRNKAQKSLNKKHNFIIGASLIIIDIFIYGLLHDISKTSIFLKLSNFFDFSTYQSFQNNFLAHFSSLPFYQFINNYFIDLLWFLSFLLITTSLLPSAKTQLFALFTAITTEILQYFLPSLGTFDFFDIILYICISILYFLVSNPKSIFL